MSKRLQKLLVLEIDKDLTLLASQVRRVLEAHSDLQNLYEENSRSKKDKTRKIRILKLQLLNLSAQTLRVQTKLEKLDMSIESL